MTQWVKRVWPWLGKSGCDADGGPKAQPQPCTHIQSPQLHLRTCGGLVWLALHHLRLPILDKQADDFGVGLEEEEEERNVNDW